MTKLIIDSTCDLNEAMRKHPKLEYLPLNIIIDEKSYKDGIDIDLERVYEVMRKGEMPQTSQIDIASLLEILDRKSQRRSDLFVFLERDVGNTCSRPSSIWDVSRRIPRNETDFD